MRLGGPILASFDSAAEWIALLQKEGYRAALCPVAAAASDSEVEEYRKASAEADIVVAEVGAWSNPISSDPSERQKALDYCKTQLELADRIGARCCVNIAGSRGSRWDGPHPDNLSEETFAMVVQSVQEIIDSVGPSETFYTLEPMPWIFPDSPDSYLRLMEAVDRHRFAVHLDIVNMINNPWRCFFSAQFTDDCFSKLGPAIKSCHGKDTIIRDSLTVHLEEAAPGQGMFDFSALFRGMKGLPEDTPLMLEHLQTMEEYRAAASHLRRAAAAMDIEL